MVDRDDLEALDYLLWHRTGQRAAAFLGCHQATVSRRLSRCRRVFGLQMHRQRGEWHCDPNPLLELERYLHQLGRFRGHRPLRIEGFPMGSSSLLLPLPPGWVAGGFDHVGVDRPLQLLRERVIDAWLSDADQDIPEPLSRGLAVWPLWRAPVQLVADPCHPLAGERELALADLHRFPSLDLPAEGYQRSRQLFQALGFGDRPTSMRRYDRAAWEGLTTDQLTLACSTPLNRLLKPETVVLQAPPLFWNGGSLLTRLDQADQPAIVLLEATLRLRLRSLAGRIPQCQLL